MTMNTESPKTTETLKHYAVAVSAEGETTIKFVTAKDEIEALFKHEGVGYNSKEKFLDDHEEYETDAEDEAESAEELPLEFFLDALSDQDVYAAVEEIPTEFDKPAAELL